MCMYVVKSEMIVNSIEFFALLKNLFLTYLQFFITSLVENNKFFYDILDMPWINTYM